MSENNSEYSEIWTNDGPDGRLVRKDSQTPSVLREADQILAEKKLKEEFPEIMEAFGPKVETSKEKPINIGHFEEKKNNIFDKAIDRLVGKIRGLTESNGNVQPPKTPESSSK